jgi:hypothetical protein
VSYCHVHVELSCQSRKNFVRVEHAQPTILLEDLVDEVEGGNHDILSQNCPLDHNRPFLYFCLGSSNFRSRPLVERPREVVSMTVDIFLKKETQKNILKHEYPNHKLDIPTKGQKDISIITVMKCMP